MGDESTWRKVPRTFLPQANQGQESQGQESQGERGGQGRGSQGQDNQGERKGRPYNTRELELFVFGVRQLGLELNEQELEQFLRYRQELLEWNTRINLTAITDLAEVLLKHFLDSLSLLLVYDRPAAHLLDIGAGAGFPGLPLKVVRPGWQVLLLEATGKKVTFMQHVIETLQLRDVLALHGRAEELGRDAGYRASFDVVTARAVASLPTLLEYAAPFCRVGGQIILPRKGDLVEELAQAKLAAGRVGVVLRDDMPVTLVGLEDGRRLLVWEQVKECPAQFPRSGAVIAKRPLGKKE